MSLSLIKHGLHKVADTSAEPVPSPAISWEQRVPFPIILRAEATKQLVSFCLLPLVQVGCQQWQGRKGLAQLWDVGWEKADWHVSLGRCGAHPRHSEMLWNGYPEWGGCY